MMKHDVALLTIIYNVQNYLTLAQNNGTLFNHENKILLLK